MNFYTKVQPREELWNLTNKVPSGTRSKFESLVLFPTCGGRGLFAQHSIPAPPSGTCCVPSPHRCAGPEPGGGQVLGPGATGRGQVSTWLSQLGLKNFRPPSAQQAYPAFFWHGSCARPQSLPCFFRLIWVPFL